MTTITAQSMQDDVYWLLSSNRDDDKRTIYVYIAADGTALTVELTRYEAYIMDCWWYGQKIANENYNRADD